MFSLEGKNAIVTGGGSGIGLGISKTFAQQGAHVDILEINIDAGESAAKDIAEAGGSATSHACNVSNQSEVKAVFEAIAGKHSIDCLINNAGIAQPLGTLEIEPDDYDLVLDVCLRGTFNMCQAVLPAMQTHQSGSIINLSSVAGQRGGGLFGGPHYAAAKAGVLGLTKTLAREQGPYQIRVNAICPAMIDTDIFAGQLSEENRATFVAATPMGRVGQPLDVAGCALFLASDLSAYVTGSEIDVNGGFHIH